MIGAGPTKRVNSPTLWIVLCWFALSPMFASSAFASDGEAGQIDEFMRYGADVRSLGMGRAYVALADDASALYYNPAGLMRLPRGRSFYGMHFRPLYESDLSFVSFALSRPDPNATGWKDLFFGPRSAWGVSFLHFGSDGYAQRDVDDNLIDDNFGLYQQALMIAYAREAVGTAGILGYGVTFKLVRQGITDAGSELVTSKTGFGLDLGAQLQMINPPVLKKLTGVPLVGPFFELRHLMPLRLGLSIRNAVAPDLGYGGEGDKYPTAMRIGGSYRLPTDRLLRDSRLFIVGDFEWLYDDIDRLIRFDRRVEVHDIAPGAGQYFGTEFQYNGDKLEFSPRLGLSHVYDDWKVSAGVGLGYEASDFDIQIDFAHGYHKDFADDQRFSLTIRFGGKRDACYFAPEGQNATSLPLRYALLHVLSGYPRYWGEIKTAASILAEELDPENKQRYLDFIGGPDRARYLAAKAIEAFQACDTGTAHRYALLAIAEYEVFLENASKGFIASIDERCGGVVSDTVAAVQDYDYLLYGQCEMINAATGGGSSGYERALGILKNVRTAGAFKHFLDGICRHKLGRFDGAAGSFASTLSTAADDARGLRTLSRLWLGHALLNSDQPDSSIALLSVLTVNHALPAPTVNDDYPRYWTFSDQRVQDDAQLLVAQAYLKLGDEVNAAAEFAKVCRFYPGSDSCPEAERETDRLIRELLEKSR